MPRYVRQDGQAVPISDLPYPIDASGVSFTDSGLTVITGISDVQAALVEVDAALDDRPTQSEMEDYIGRGVVAHKLASASVSEEGSALLIEIEDVTLETGRLYNISGSTGRINNASGDTGSVLLASLVRGGSGTTGTNINRVGGVGGNIASASRSIVLKPERGAFEGDGDTSRIAIVGSTADGLFDTYQGGATSPWSDAWLRVTDIGSV